MQKRRLAGILTFSLLLTVIAHAQPSEEKAIAYAKSLSASHLDSMLPQIRFSEWLAGIVGGSAVVQWELNDCGEQTGEPAIDSTQDVPICVGVDVTLPGERKIGIMISVGTHSKGLTGAPAVFDMYFQSKGKSRTVRRLSDLGPILRQSSR